MTKKALRILSVFIGGALLSFVLYVLAAATMESHFGIQKHLLEAHTSDAAYTSATTALRAKNEWRDFLALPIIGCLIGVYAAFVQRKRAPILAVACLLPMLAFEANGVSVGSWAFITDLQVAASRAAEFLLAVVAAVSLRGFLDRRVSRVTPASSPPS